jgi:uncharacterized protein YcbX
VGVEAERWLTAFLEKPTLLLRNYPDTVKQLNTKLMIHSDPDDRTKNMTSKAAMHLFNESSMRFLRKSMMGKYNEEEKMKLRIDTESFRPNIIIDTGKEFEEDSFDQMRIGNVMMRLVGYCSRCKAIAINLDTWDENPDNEPNETLSSFRKHKDLGNLFGTYH